MRLAFLDVLRPDQGGLRAVVLVTDDRTRPLEFRLTEPLQMSPLQETLYGQAYDEQVYGDLLVVPLLRALREEPDWILVRDEALLELEDHLVEAVDAPRPLLWIGRDEDSPDGGAVLGFRDGAVGVDAARAALRGIAGQYDLVEPFARIERALGQLEVGDSGDACSSEAV